MTIHRTKEDGRIRRWREVALTEWDNTSESKREILMRKDGKGVVFVRELVANESYPLS